MRSHNETCTGEDCPRCNRLIDAREYPDPGAESDWQEGQDAYERDLDRRGGSA